MRSLLRTLYRFLIECLVALEKGEREKEEKARKKRYLKYLSGLPSQK